MRYIGQAFDLCVNFPANLTSEALEKAFYDAYEMLYGQAYRHEKTEIVNIRVSGIHHNPRPALSVKRQAVTLPSGKFPGPHGRATSKRPGLLTARSANGTRFRIPPISMGLQSSRNSASRPLFHRVRR